MPKSTKIILILAVLIVVGGVSFVVFTKNTNTVVNTNNNQNTNIDINENTNINTNNNQGLEVDTSDWQTYDPEKEGVKSNVLQNFKYPTNWYTYNFSGGNAVDIYFSDGGNLSKSNNSSAQIQSMLMETEIESANIRENECKILFSFRGANNSFWKVFNTKIDVNDKKYCDEVLLLMEKM